MTIGMHYEQSDHGLQTIIASIIVERPLRLNWLSMYSHNKYSMQIEKKNRN